MVGFHLDFYYLIIIFFVAFLLGSIPWGLIVSKVFFRKDIREHGSGNIGTTNAMRSLGKIGGGAVFVLDFGKGVLSAMVALFIVFWVSTPDANLDAVLNTTLYGSAASIIVIWPYPEIQDTLAVAVLGCTLGHIFSPWLKFKGGKGIAVAIGCILLTYSWVGFCLELAIFIGLVYGTKRVSIGSIAAGAACPFMALWLYWGNPFAIVVCSLVGVAVIWAHRENIKRLRAGTEPKIGDKKKQEELNSLEES